jgi:hypothetical protein
LRTGTIARATWTTATRTTAADEEDEADYVGGATEERVYDRLAEEKKIAVIWTTADVRRIRPDLSEDQAWEVLQKSCSKHDANVGINWATLETFAAFIFGPAPEGIVVKDED